MWEPWACARLESDCVQLWHLLHALSSVSVYIYTLCVYINIYVYIHTAPGWHSCSADWAVFLALVPPTSAVSFCGLLCAPWQGAGKAQLSFVSAFEAFMIYLSSQIAACKVGRAFPRGEEST